MLDVLAMSAPHFPGAETFDHELVIKWQQMMTNCLPRWEQILQGCNWIVNDGEADHEALERVFGEGPVV